VSMTKHTDAEINEAAARFETWADNLDPAELQDVSELRAVTTAARKLEEDETQLRQAVEIARGRGHSWNRIAVALGVSRQAARQRFSDKTHV
jgi:hypothetical protein